MRPDQAIPIAPPFRQDDPRAVERRLRRVQPVPKGTARNVGRDDLPGPGAGGPSGQVVRHPGMQGGAVAPEPRQGIRARRVVERRDMRRHGPGRAQVTGRERGDRTQIERRGVEIPGAAIFLGQE